MSLLAIASVVAPPMGAMNEITSPLGLAVGADCGGIPGILPLIKRRSLDGALIAYRTTFGVYAVLLARLVIGTAPTLTVVERVVLGLAFAGVLAMSVAGHVGTARLRAERPTGGLQSRVVP